MTSLLNNTNILQLALSVIPPRTIYLHKFLSIEVSEDGLDIPTFDNPIEVEAIVQAVQSNNYKELNLDFTKKYWYVHSTSQINDNSNQAVSDVLSWDGKFYNITSKSDWYGYNGWNSVIACERKGDVEL